jgi:hypothetical protein
MIVTVKDSDTSDSIVGLLRTLPEYDVTVRRTDECLLVTVFRQANGFRGT